MTPNGMPSGTPPRRVRVTSPQPAPLSRLKIVAGVAAIAIVLLISLYGWVGSPGTELEFAL